MPAELRILIAVFIALLFLVGGHRARRAKARAESPAVKALASAAAARAPSPPGCP